MSPTITPPPLLSSLLSQSTSDTLHSASFASHLDSTDPLRSFRDEFIIPKKSMIGIPAERESGGTVEAGEDVEQVGTYLAGNSLGCLPKSTEKEVLNELRNWGTLAVLGHTEHDTHDWLTVDEKVTHYLAQLVGAKTEETVLPSGEKKIMSTEVACMGSLTANLNALFTSFYQPTPTRHKILYEAKCFPSDAYAFASQISLRDYPPSSLLPLEPLPGEYTLRTSEILKVIEEQGESIAVICFGAVQYYTGQYFDMKAITEAGHAKGCIVAFDLAHAIGNVPIELHDWGVDFAAWCSYKYLNSGPGGIAGIFVHERHAERKRLQGWWGHDLKTRFQMPEIFSPLPGARGFQFSNPSVLDVAALHASLKIYDRASKLPALATSSSSSPSEDPTSNTHYLAPLRTKSILLTTYLDYLLSTLPSFVPLDSFPPSTTTTTSFTILTPPHPYRGAQLSLLFHPVESMDPIFDKLRRKGVLGDERRPGVIRLAPVPLYNSFKDCWDAARAVGEAVEEWDQEKK